MACEESTCTFSMNFTIDQEFFMSATRMYITVNLNFCVKPTKIHFCNRYERSWYVLLPIKDIYVYPSHQSVGMVNETKKVWSL